ncbi:collagen binding domain-containing protein [Paraclostridium bifermentans]|uniref:Collagen binding domain-containing protein n=2 Tax=Paraclostridium bifermentans TaxID=1490 RepID=A0AA44IG32_PARBF|nr:SpaA isopeptide-forming pilin-related protein [Paraclostridium bifermentans]MBN8047758.1 collagen binding domain-containing protein [Paraclostridium bifermentans]NME08407.1 collagen binding domain-containing protein [Paraclostridium bifermentans]
MRTKKRYRMLSMIVILNLILSIISPGMTVFAENNNVKLTLTSNKTKLESGEQVEFNLNYEALNGPGSIKAGDTITFKLPDVFENIQPKYPPEHFKSVNVDGTTVTAVFSEGANDAIGGYMSVKATAKNVETNTTQRVEVNLNGTVQYIDVEIVPPDEKPPVDPPTVTDRQIYKTVDNPDGYDGYENGTLINNINNPVIGKKVKYSIYVNEKYATMYNSYIKDTIPDGMELAKDSVKIYETQYGQPEKDVTEDFQGKINTQNNSVNVNFGTTYNKYRVSYSVIIKQNMQRYDNVVDLIKHDETLSSKAIVKPKDDGKMLTKYSRTNETAKDENGNTINIVNLNDNKVKYTLDINPNNQSVTNAIIEDNIPDGMKLVDGSIMVGTYDISDNFEWVTDKMKDKIKFENNKLTVNIGNTDKHYLIYYDLEVTQRQKAYTNKAKLSYDNTSKDVQNVVRYEMNAGAINARKKVDKTLLKKGDNQIVNYTIDFDCYGYFDKGYLNLTDKLDPKVEILGVDAPEHFNVNIDKESNTIKITNDKKEIEYGEPLQVKIKTDFSKVEDGKTVTNVAKINNSTTNKVETKKGYRFTAQKIDRITKSPLSGATFNLIDNNKKVIATLNSDSNGILSHSIDNPGVYYLRETKAPKGYNLDSKEIKFSINENQIGTTIDLGNIVNTQSDHNATIKKVDADNEKKVLEGAVFEIQNLSGSKITTVTTGKDGIANIKLSPGKYKAVEKKAPQGYILNTDPIQFEIKLDSDSDINLVVKNDAIKGKIEITKTDSKDSKKVLANTEFTIFDSNKKEVAKAMTNKEGKIEFDNLVYGNYYYQETKAPEGYTIDNEMYAFEIKDNNQVISKVAKDDAIKGKIEITKTDSKDSKKVLANTEFTIFDSNKKEIAKAMTNKEGKVEFDNLGYGNYYYQETKAPEGYTIDNTKHAFKIETNNQVVTNTIKNNEIIGKLEIIKVDAKDAKKFLPGTEFTVFDKDGKVVSKAVTDKDGKVVFDNLVYGEYTYQETKAPNGYVIDNTKHAFKIEIDNQVVTNTIKNGEIQGKLEITKVDAKDAKKFLPGTEFTVFDKSGKEVSKAVTDKDGKVVFDNLVYGEYTYQEIKAPEGYVIDNTKHAFKIETDKQVVSHTVTNGKIKGKIEITKTDSKDSKKVLANTEFIIFDSNKKEIAKATTNKEGKVEFDNLGYGNYYYQETKAPEGYTIDNKMYPFEIKDNNQVVSKTVSDDKIIGKIEITKTDSKDSKKVLANTEFTIFDSNKKEVAKAMTNKEGKAEFDNLGYGNYYYQETKAPEGYRIDNKMYPFEIKDNNQVISKIVTNDPIVVEEIKKDDSNSKNEENITSSNQGKDDSQKDKINSSDNKTSYESKNSNSPQTYDNSMLPYIGLFTISTIGLAASTFNKRRK